MRTYTANFVAESWPFATNAMARVFSDALSKRAEARTRQMSAVAPGIKVLVMKAMETISGFVKTIKKILVKLVDYFPAPLTNVFTRPLPDYASIAAFVSSTGVRLATMADDATGITHGFAQHASQEGASVKASASEMAERLFARAVPIWEKARRATPAYGAIATATALVGRSAEWGDESDSDTPLGRQSLLLEKMDIAKVQSLVALVEKDPSQLHLPQLAFFKKYLEQMGATIPTPPPP